MSNEPQKLLNDIIDFSDATKYPDILKEINKVDILYKLIYNIDNTSYEIVEVRETNIQQNIETKIITEVNYITSNESILNLSLKYIYITKEYDFNNFEREYKSKTIQINEFIYIMPNIFNYFDGTDLFMNIIPSLMFIYLQTDNKLILVKKDNLKYLYDKFPIFNLELILLNKEKSYKLDYKKINVFKELNLIKMFSRNNNDININLLNNFEKIIIYLYLNNIKRLTISENKLNIEMKQINLNEMFSETFYEKIMSIHNPENILKRYVNNDRLISLENAYPKISSGGYKLITKNDKIRFFKLKNIII